MSIPVPKVIRVTRADVYAARTRVELDRQSGLVSPAWVHKLAQVDLYPGPSGPRPRQASLIRLLSRPFRKA